MRRSSKGMVLAVCLFSGCAYYNTFFNARQFFDQANYERENSTSTVQATGGQAQYRKSIEKCQKLLENHPKSRYIDDALFLAGQSFFYLQEYRQSQRSFREMQRLHPQSPFVMEASLWLAKIDMVQNRPEEAKERLKLLSVSSLPSVLKAETWITIGELREREGDREGAIAAYREGLIGLKKKSKILFTIAANLDTLGRYEEAAAYFLTASKSGAPRDLLVESRFRYALIQKKLGNLGNAVTLLRNLLTAEKQSRTADIRLELASCFALSGMYEEAFEEYDKIIAEHRSAPQAAEAAFRTARLYENEKNNYARAIGYYRKVGEISRRSAFGDTAAVREQDILQWIALNSMLRPDSTGKDSIAFQQELEAMREESLPDTVGTRGRGMESVRRDVENPELKKLRREEVDKNTYLLAELSILRFGKTDTAKVLLHSLIDRYPESPYVPKALWTLAYLAKKAEEDSAARSYLLRVARQHSGTPYAAAAGVELGLPTKTSAEDSARSIYLEAETHILNKAYSRALRPLTEIEKQFRKTEWAPRALYSLAYCLERMKSKERAAAAYDSLAVRYPDTSWGRSARAKLDAVKKAAAPPDTTNTKEEAARLE